MLATGMEHYPSDRQNVVALISTKTSFANLIVKELWEIVGALKVVHVICSVRPHLSDLSCAQGHYTCHDGTCILEHYICDGAVDCPDDSDEQECQHVCSNYHLLIQHGTDCYSSCLPGICTCHDLYFQCNKGGCVPWSRVCDGIPDCPRQEDEELCLFYHHLAKDWMKAAASSTKIHWESEQDQMHVYNCSSGLLIDASLL